MGKKEKKKSTFSLAVGRMFGKKTENRDIFEEEIVRTPFRTICHNFYENKLAMGSLILFLLIFLTVLIGPVFVPIDLSDQEETQTNVALGFDLMKYPKGLEGNVKQISVGSTFSVGLDNDGKVYVWGKTKRSKVIDLADIPENIGKVVAISAGYDHIMALNDNGKVICWGNDRLAQVTVPRDIYRAGKIVQVCAGYQLSAVVTENGKVFTWGNENLNDIKTSEKTGQGTIKKIVYTNNTLMGLKEDGTVTHMGRQDCYVSQIPDGLNEVTDIAATSNSMAAVKKDGTIVTWGAKKYGEDKVPKIDGTIKTILGGRFHYTVLTEDGKLYGWGKNNYHQTDIPKIGNEVEEVYSGYYQNYAITKSGDIKTWGLKGYLMGSDDLGRDVFARLLNGGRMTMTIGAVSVILSTLIGIIVGGVSGFFGGWVDLLLQRLTELVSSLPFLPLAMILTTIIGNKLSDNARIFMIMVILGLLSWPSLARLVRAQVLAEREKEFVTAANAMGVKKGSIVFRYIIPNVISVIIVSATLDFASCMLIESSLSYLGFGVKLPRPTWGNMLYGCVSSVVIQNYWWRWVFPAIMLSICVICINTVGDGLRDAIDPKSNER
ncbi:MAG: ABC transporter permease subunit [Lachnospiraceae bacterium]